MVRAVWGVLPGPGLGDRHEGFHQRVRADTIAVAARGLRARARRVLVSGPSAAAGVTVVLGANEAALRRQAIVSNACCHHRYGSLVKLLDAGWGVVTGSVTTIHCCTGSQPTIDGPAADFARSRAAALSIVPATTSAQRLLDLVLPGLAGRIEGAAVRVPTAAGRKIRPQPAPTIAQTNSNPMTRLDDRPR